MTFEGKKKLIITIFYMIFSDLNFYADTFIDFVLFYQKLFEKTQNKTKLRLFNRF